MLSVFTLREVSKKSVTENGQIEYCPQHVIGSPKIIFMKTETGYKTFQMAGLEIFNKQKFDTLAQAKSNVNKIAA